jgi:hypothetical protein
MIEMGILDPTKVTRTALQNAASVASLMPSLMPSLKAGRHHPQNARPGVQNLIWIEVQQHIERHPFGLTQKPLVELAPVHRRRYSSNLPVQRVIHVQRNVFVICHQWPPVGRIAQ